MKTSSQPFIEITPPESGGSYRSFKLASGLRVILYSDPGPVSYAGYIIAAGSSADPRSFHGIAHFAEHMLFKGTLKRNARQIINRMEEVGADFNAYTTKEETFVYTAFPHEYFSRVLDMMTDVVLHSTCPPEETERERGVIIEEIHSYRDTPADRIFDEYENLLFHGTPLGHNILGTEDSVRRISSAAVRKYMRQHFTPSRMAFCYRGTPIDPEPLLAFLADHFGESSFPQEVEAVSPLLVQNGTFGDDKVASPLPLRTSVTHNLDTFQAHRIVGYHAYSLSNRRRVGLTLLNNILGGRGMNSRLNLSLREDKGLVYNVESSFYPFRNAGLLSIYFATSKEKLHEATDAVLREVMRLRQESIPEKELRIAKRQFIGQMTVQEDNHESAFLEMGKSFLYFNRFQSIEQVKERINRLTSTQLQAIACEMFLPETRLILTYK